MEVGNLDSMLIKSAISTFDSMPGIYQKLLAPRWVLCQPVLERASSTILEKGQFFCQRKQNVVQTGSMLVNCHITVARACQPPPGVDRKYSPEKMFLWDPSFVWPKSVRFGHGFKRNFDRKLICRFVLRGVLLFQVHLSTLNRMPGIYSKFLTPRFPRWVLCLSALEIVYN